MKLSADLRSTLAAVEILDISRYRVAGEEMQVTEPMDLPAREELESANRLSLSIATDLYDRLYCRSLSTSGSSHDSRFLLSKLLAQISGGNLGKGTWEPGWSLERQCADGTALMDRQGIVYRVPAGGFRFDADGPTYRVFIPAESHWLLPGYYLARGNAEKSAQATDVKVVRVYWHLRAADAATLVRVLTTSLNECAIPFSLKVLRSPARYRRADAGVLYLEPAAYGAARNLIRAAWEEVKDRLRPETPLFTFPLASGLALAEGNRDRQSFGQERCRLIAAALVRSFMAGRTSLAERSAALASDLEAAGLDPGRPYLAVGSHARYEPFENSAGTIGEEKSHVLESSLGLLPLASRIGDAICSQAFWHRDRCNWMGQRDRSIAALPADMYRGTAGIGLFLAELFCRTGDARHRRTARGALRQALASGRDSRPLSFYTGELGIAFSCRRVGFLIEDESLNRSAEQVMARILTKVETQEWLDVIQGAAGAVGALLAISELAGARELAIVLGKSMVAAARRDGDRVTWCNEAVAGWGAEFPPLTGFAHGAAGLGWALFELFAATGEKEFLETGRSAFSYEDSLYDPGNLGWPDLREQGKSGPRFSVAWCHGAAGILLSRLRARMLDPRGSTAYDEPIRAGLETMLRTLDERSFEGDADTSLCHGLSGLLDIAILAADSLREEAPRAAALGAMERLAVQHSAARSWPSGLLPGSTTPSLFLGEAGIGYTCLRLADSRQIPTVLLPGAEAPTGIRKPSRVPGTAG